MLLHIQDTWLWFSIAFALMLFASLIMAAQGKQFFTHNVVTQKFSMLDLEFAASARELADIIGGIYQLPDLDNNGNHIDKDRVIRALKGQLLVDLFLYMPAVYGANFLLCMKVANRVGGIGPAIF